MNLTHCILFVALAVGGSPRSSPSLPATSAKPDGDERLFREAFLDPSPEGILDFFRTRTVPPNHEQLTAFIKQLDAPDAATRDRASGALIRAGMAAVALLRSAANSIEGTNSARARQCLDLIEGRDRVFLTRVAVHLAVARKPAGIAGVLLAYLPFSEDDIVVEEIEEALANVSQTNGRPDPALLTGLSDSSPVRRAAAAKALCRTGDPDALAAIQPLLKDPRPNVRLCAALGLADQHDAEAIPVLIDLLADGGPPIRKKVEEFLNRLANEWGLATPQGNDSVAANLRREAWLSWWHGVDGAALLQEFRNRTLTDVELEHTRGLIQQLNDESAEVREKAIAGLVDSGRRVAPLLRRLVQSGGRAAALAAHCLEDIENDSPRPLPAAAYRLLALRHPTGTVETLLAYLPSADSDEAVLEMVDLLPDLGVHQGKAEPALVAGLEDKLPMRRAAAAYALCKGKAIDQLPAVRKLLHDSDADVRLRVALSLARTGDKEAMPTLIALLADHPRIEKAREAEDFLLSLAGDKAPAFSLSTALADRTKALEAWSTWWNEHGKDIDITRVEESPQQFGYFLTVELWSPDGGGFGRVTELDCDGRVRWQVGGLMGPQYAQILPGNRILVAEQNGNRVTERDMSGKILWERPLAAAFHCQRLSNGNTFMAGRNILVEINRSGKEIFSLHRSEMLSSAHRFRDGQIAFVTNQGNYFRLDAAGKEVKSFNISTRANRFGMSSTEVLPGDRVIACIPQLNKVAEYDAEGKVIWETSLPNPGNTTRLSNGHTLVVIDNASRVVELDRTGRMIGEWKDLPVHPSHVDRR